MRLWDKLVNKKNGLEGMVVAMNSELGTVDVRCGEETKTLTLAQLERYPQMLERRKAIIEKYDSAFKPLGVEVLEHFNDEYTSSGHLYITRLPGLDAQQRNDVITKMAEMGVATNVHYKPLPMHTAYKKLGFDIADYPNAYARFENEVTLPLHTCLTDEQVGYVADSYINIVKEYLR